MLLMHREISKPYVSLVTCLYMLFETAANHRFSFLICSSPYFLQASLVTVIHLVNAVVDSVGKAGIY